MMEGDYMREKSILGYIVAILIILLMFCYVFSQYRSQEVGQEIIEELSSMYNLEEREKDNLKHILEKSYVLIEEYFDEAIIEDKVDLQTAQSRFEHMKRVSLLSLKLAQALESEEDILLSKEEIEDLVIAGYLHDICKFDKGSHSENGASYVKLFLEKETDLDKERIKRITQLIYYHSAPLTHEEKEEVESYLLLIKLLQDADAADKIIYQKKNVDKHYGELNLSSSKAYINQLSNGFSIR